MHQSSRDVRRGIAAGVGAGLLWGLAFLVPMLLDEIGAVDLALGRYLVYGLLSAALLRAWPDRDARRSAFFLAVTGHVGYYVLLVVAVGGAGAPLTAIVVGGIPVAVAVAGALRAGRSLRPLRVPLGLIGAGLALVNGAALLAGDAGGGDAVGLGLLAAAAATAVWTAYGVANAEFLRRRPDVGAGEWNSIVGAATLLPAGLLLAGRTATGGPAPEPLWGFVAGALVLGVLVSWLAGVLWNRASADLPIERAGQLIVVETLAGAAYGYAAGATPPDVPTLLGLGLITAGVLRGQRA